MSEQRRFWRDCADAQACLNLRCSHRPKVTNSLDAAHLMLHQYKFNVILPNENNTIPLFFKWNLIPSNLFNVGAASLLLLCTNVPMRENLFSAFLIISDASDLSSQGRGLGHGCWALTPFDCLSAPPWIRPFRSSSLIGDDISRPLNSVKYKRK